jgi:enoyl-CoA hydratase/carnithine racemase
MSDRVRLEIDNELALVTLTRAEKHNGIDFEMIDGVLGAIRTLKRARQVRAAIVSGEGPSFCAGLDFKSVFAKPLKAALGFSSLWSPVRNRFQQWSMGWRDLPFPVIAAVHGNAFGGGAQLALGADIRIAAPDAKISIMESKWGLIPDMGGAALLRELVGIDVAKELCFTSRVLSGSEAHALKLVTHVSENPLAHARKLAQEIMTRSPDAVASAKFLLQRAWDSGESATLAQERRYQRKLLGSRNQRIAVERNMKKSEQPFQKRRIAS